MTYKIVALFVVVGVIAFVSAFAVPEEFHPVPAGIELFEDVPEHYRQKRATCDLLSGFGVNHSACSIHCVARGFRGGWCDSRAVCNCRR